ncbi:MAG TPA: energy transducer TonB [Pyrinomonadaceae bacterium]|nr:energy transducer TonB [Pyrinomonadaceae bacterium]
MKPDTAHMTPLTNGLKVVIRLCLERPGRVSDVRVEKSSGDNQFDASAVQAVRRASPVPPVPDTVLDPTRPVPEQFPGQQTWAESKRTRFC